MRWKLFAVPLATLIVASPLLASCKKDNPKAKPMGTLKPGEGYYAFCTGWVTGDFNDLEFTGPQGTGENVKRYLVQSRALARTVPDFEKQLIDACFELGMAAGVPENELKAQPDHGHGAERVCANAAAKVKKMFDEAKAAKVTLDLQIEPMHCYADIDAGKKCLADCGAPTSADDRVACTGGEVKGSCAGRCSEGCLLDPGAGSGLCHGTCSGKCDHDFRGKCDGKCSGTCNGRPTHGPSRCIGVCDGACNDKAEGMCIGKCDGTCNGPWEPSQSWKCPGLCVGTCAAGSELKSPVCTGDYAPKGAEPVCQAACTAASALHDRCDLPLISLTAKGVGKQSPDLQKLLAGIQSAVPKILRLQQLVGKRLPHAIEVATAAGVEWTNAFATVGNKPLFCIREALDAMKDTSAWIDATVKAAEPISPAIKTEAPLQGPKPEDD